MIERLLFQVTQEKKEKNSYEKKFISRKNWSWIIENMKMGKLLLDRGQIMKMHNYQVKWVIRHQKRRFTDLKPMLMPQVVETLICKEEFSKLMGEVAGLQVGQVEMKLLKTIIMKMRKKRRFLRILLIVLLATILSLIIKEL